MTERFQGNNKDSIEIVENYYSRLNISGNRSYLKKSRKKIDYVLRRVRKYLKPSMRVCDIGIGDGYLLERLHDAGLKVTGIDVSSFMIEYLNDYFKRKKLEIELIQGNISNLMLENNRFDIITCFDVLEHISNLDTTLATLRKSLTNKGLLIGTLPMGENLDDNMIICPKCRHEFHRSGHAHSFMKSNDIKNLLKEFTILKTGEAPFILFNTDIQNVVSVLLYKCVRRILRRQITTTVYFVARFNKCRD